MDLKVFCVHKNHPKRGICASPIHCSCKNSKCTPPRRASLPAGYKLQDYGFTGGCQRELLNLDNSKSRIFLYSWFTRLMPRCLQQEKLLANLADKLVPEWHFSERQAEPFPDITQHQTSHRLQNLHNLCLKLL